MTHIFEFPSVKRLFDDQTILTFTIGMDFPVLTLRAIYQMALTTLFSTYKGGFYFLQMMFQEQHHNASPGAVQQVGNICKPFTTLTVLYLHF